MRTSDVSSVHCEVSRSILVPVNCEPRRVLGHGFVAAPGLSLQEAGLRWWFRFVAPICRTFPLQKSGKADNVVLLLVLLVVLLFVAELLFVRAVVSLSSRGA